MKIKNSKKNPGFSLSAGALLLLAGNNIVYAEQGVEAEGTEEPRIDTISVTATRVERATKDVPSAISVIDSEQIEGAKMMNIKDAIQGIPGVLIDSKNGGYDVRLIIRGAGQKANYGVREIMVLRDGVPITDPDSFSRFDYFDTQDIEHIEITKGPGSLYGAGSAGGTIQIISKSVFDSDADRIKLGIGNHGAINLNLRVSGDINDENAMAVTASHRELKNSWRRWNEFDTNQLGLKHGLMLEDGSTLESELSYTAANLQLPGSMSEEQYEEFQDTGEQNDTQDAWKHSGRYSKILFFNSRLEKEWGDLLFKPRVYYNHWTHYHPVTGAINDNNGTDVLGTDLEFIYEHQLLGESTLVAGVTARVEDTDDARKYEYRDVRTIPFGPQAGRIIANLSLGYETGPHNISFNIDNLFDKRYAVEVKKDTRGKKSGHLSGAAAHPGSEAGAAAAGIPRSGVGTAYPAGEVADPVAAGVRISIDGRYRLGQPRPGGSILQDLPQPHPHKPGDWGQQPALPGQRQ